MDTLLIILVGTGIACALELWRLLRAIRLLLVERAATVLAKAFQVLENANDVAENLENASGDVAETTESLKAREKRGLLGWL